MHHATCVQVGWVSMSYILTAELIGMGVLSLPTAFQALGHNHTNINAI